MKRIFLAREPGRYVQTERDFTLGPGEEHIIQNSVTGYKMELDMDTMVYDSFISENGSPVWTPYSTGKHISSKADFWREVGDGHLVEKDA